MVRQIDNEQRMNIMPPDHHEPNSDPFRGQDPRALIDLVLSRVSDLDQEQNQGVREFLREDLLEQIQYSVRRLTKDLIDYLDFSEEDAKRVSTSIGPLAVMFALGVQISSRSLDSFLLKGQEGIELTEPEQQEHDKQRRIFLHNEITPEIMAYLSDWIMDNPPEEKPIHPNAIESIVAEATELVFVHNSGEIYTIESLTPEEAQLVFVRDSGKICPRLEAEPQFYLKKIMRFFNLVWNSIDEDDSSSLIDNPSFIASLRNDQSRNLGAFILLIPLLELLKRSDISEEEARDILRCLNDAITFGHLPVVLWQHHSKENKFVSTLPNYTDYIITKMKMPQLQSPIPAYEAAALAMNRNGGGTLVALLMDTLSQLYSVYDPEKQRFATSRKPNKKVNFFREEVAHNKLFVALLKVLEFCIRLRDDLADYLEDLQNGLPNTLTAHLRLRMASLQAAFGDVGPNTAFGKLLSFRSSVEGTINMGEIRAFSLELEFAALVNEIREIVLHWEERVAQGGLVALQYQLSANLEKLETMVFENVFPSESANDPEKKRFYDIEKSLQATRFAATLSSHMGFQSSKSAA